MLLKIIPTPRRRSGERRQRQLAGSYLWLKKKKAGKKSSPRVQGASRLNVGAPCRVGCAGEGAQSDLPPPHWHYYFPCRVPPSRPVA